MSGSSHDTPEYPMKMGIVEMTKFPSVASEISTSQSLGEDTLKDLVKSGNVEIVRECASDIPEYFNQEIDLLHSAARSGHLPMVEYIFSLTTNNRAYFRGWKREFALTAIKGGNMQCIEFALAQQDTLMWNCGVTERACRYAPLEVLKTLRKGLLFKGKVYPLSWDEETMDGLALRAQTGDVKEFFHYIYGDMTGPEICPWSATSTKLAVLRGNLPFLECARDNQQRIMEKLKLKFFWYFSTLEVACESKNLLLLKLVYENSGQQWSTIVNPLLSSSVAIQTGDYLVWTGPVECLAYAVSQGYIISPHALRNLRRFHESCNGKCHHLEIYRWIVHNISLEYDLPPLR